jgi:hypothetical protein
MSRDKRGVVNPKVPGSNPGATATGHGSARWLAQPRPPVHLVAGVARDHRWFDDRPLATATPLLEETGDNEEWIGSMRKRVEFKRVRRIIRGRCARFTRSSALWQRRLARTRPQSERRAAAYCDVCRMDRIARGSRHTAFDRSLNPAPKRRAHLESHQTVRRRVWRESDAARLARCLADSSASLIAGRSGGYHSPSNFTDRGHSCRPALVVLTLLSPARTSRFWQRFCSFAANWLWSSSAACVLGVRAVPTG